MIRYESALCTFIFCCPFGKFHFFLQEECDTEIIPPEPEKDFLPKNKEGFLQPVWRLFSKYHNLQNQPEITVCERF